MLAYSVLNVTHVLVRGHRFVFLKVFYHAGAGGPMIRLVGRGHSNSRISFLVHPVYISFLSR